MRRLNKLFLASVAAAAIATATTPSYAFDWATEATQIRNTLESQLTRVQAVMQTARQVQMVANQITMLASLGDISSIGEAMSAASRLNGLMTSFDRSLEMTDAQLESWAGEVWPDDLNMGETFDDMLQSAREWQAVGQQTLMTSRQIQGALTGSMRSVNGVNDALANMTMATNGIRGAMQGAAMLARNTNTAIDGLTTMSMAHYRAVEAEMAERMSERERSSASWCAFMRDRPGGGGAQCR